MVTPEPMAPATPTPAPPPPPTGSIDGIPQTTGFIAEITGALADLGDDVSTKDRPMAAGAIWRPGGRDVHLLAAHAGDDGCTVTLTAMRDDDGATSPTFPPCGRLGWSRRSSSIRSKK